MRTHDDPELDAFLSDVIADGERRVGERPRPDFLEVVARAHRQDPAAVDVAMLDESGRLATVVPLSTVREPVAAADPELDAFVAGVRQAADAAIHERHLVGIPSLPGPAPRRLRRRRLAAAAGLLAIAAAILLMIAPEPATLLAGADRRPTQAAMQAALDVARSVERRAALSGGGKAQDLKDMSEETSSPTTPSWEGPAAPPEPSSVAEDPPPTSEAPPTTPQRRRPAAPAAPAPASDREAALAAIDAEAQALWRRGDRSGAEARFRALIERDPRGRWAQLAYGDLFALARQRGDEAAELALWREYLARHPRGTHSDDARAGICRRSVGDERRRCWQAYLSAGPAGAYRQQAERELAGADEPAGDEPTP